MIRIHALIRALVALVAALALAIQPAAAQSVLRDAETEAFLLAISKPLVVAAGLDPRNVQIVMISDKSINAFVAGGQIVYIHSGLLTAADTVGEVQGVIAHELGHIAGGHVSLAGQNAKGASNISLLSLLVGAAAMAMGAGEAGMAAMMAGQSAAMGKYLAFSRAQEASSDAFAVTILAKAQLSGKGMLSFFGKLKREEYRYSSSYMETDPYMQSHPMSGDRQQVLDGDVKASPYYNAPTDPALEARFARIKAKLVGFVDDPKDTLLKYPETDQSVPAHYARAYAWHRAAYPDKAAEETGALVKAAPHDPYFLELQGQVLLESGKPVEALPALREAVARSDNQPLIATLFGHALIATEDPRNFDEARRVLKLAVARDDENPFAWYQLGILYERDGDRPRAALATAERYSMTGQPRLALASAQAAMNGLPQGTPDYLRAEDIQLASRAQVEDEKKRR